MNDQATILIALNEAAFIISDHFEPGLPQDPKATIKKLIEVLDSQELAAAIDDACPSRYAGQRRGADHRDAISAENDGLIFGDAPVDHGNVSASCR